MLEFNLPFTSRDILGPAISPVIGGKLSVIVSTGSIWWILWFSLRYAAVAAALREIFGVNALRGKQQQLGSPNLQDIFIGG